MTGALEAVLLTPLAEAAEESRTRPFDAAIVGGGTAGLTAARTLVEAGRRVVVLEAGPLVLLTHATTTDLRFDRNLVRAVRRGIDYSPKLAAGGTFGTLIGCVGGRGLFWNGAAPRFPDWAFANWPIGARDLSAEYAWAEREFRVSRDYGAGALGQTVIRLLRRAGFAAEPGPFAVDTRATRDGWIGGTVANAVAALLRSGVLGMDPRPLRLVARSFASRLLFDPSGRVARGVLAVDRDAHASYEVLANSVVLAAGALESARLALVSAVPDESGFVGRMVTDHLFCRVYYTMPPSLYDPRRPEAAIVFVPAEPTVPYQLELHAPGNNLFTLRSDDAWRPDSSAEYAAMVRSFGPVAARPENSIALDGADGPGAYIVNFAYTPADLALRDQMITAIERAGAALGAQPAAVQTLPPGASFHEAGGLIMGTDPARSVTDPFGRFHQVRNLVAADASTWPDTSAANPHLTIAAMARRQAAALGRDLH